jgi:hypothetical protein
MHGYKTVLSIFWLRNKYTISNFNIIRNKMAKSYRKIKKYPDERHSKI